MSSVSVRYASVADAPLISALSRQTFYETFAEQNTRENMAKFMSTQFSEEKLIAEVDTPGNIFLLAFDDKEPVGYARMRESQNPSELGAVPAIEIARIYAVANVIGKGVGKALMQECIDIAAGRKKKLIWLGVWEKNQQAISFYKKWGFEKFGTHIFQLGNDPQTDWLMKKELTQVR